MVISPDTAIQWLEKHGDQLAEYRGQQIAVHGVYGVVAHAPDLETLRAKVRELGLVGEVLLSAVPDFPSECAVFPHGDDHGQHDSGDVGSS